MIVNRAQRRTRRLSVIMFDRNAGATYTRCGMWARGMFPTVVALGAVVVGGSLSEAGAQETTTQVTQEEAPKTERSDAKRSDDVELELRSVDAGKLTNDEKKLNVERLLSRQRLGLSLVTDLTADARSRKDIVQLNCVNAKRTQLKGLLKLSQQAGSTLYEGMATGAEDTVNHEYTKIAVASQRASLLVTEAKQCVGEEAIFAGETDVTVEISADIPTADPTLPAAPPLGPAAPPVASGF